MNCTEALRGSRSAWSSQVSPHWNCQFIEETLGKRVRATRAELTPLC